MAEPSFTAPTGKQVFELETSLTFHILSIHQPNTRPWRPCAKQDKATQSCADGVHLRLDHGWISLTWTTTANRTVGRLVTKTVDVFPTFTMQNRSQRCSMFRTLDLATNRVIMSQQQSSVLTSTRGLVSSTSLTPPNTRWKTGTSSSRFP